MYLVDYICMLLVLTVYICACMDLVQMSYNHDKPANYSIQPLPSTWIGWLESQPSRYNTGTAKPLPAWQSVLRFGINLARGLGQLALLYIKDSF
jgi:hypothetical protein